MSGIGVEMVGALAKGSVREIVDSVKEGGYLPDHESAAHATALMAEIQSLPDSVKAIIIFEMACTLAELDY